MFWEAVRLIFGQEYLEKDWRPHSILDISSLFLALALMVANSKPEVLSVARKSLELKWGIGVEDVVN